MSKIINIGLDNLVAGDVLMGVVPKRIESNKGDPNELVYIYWLNDSRAKGIIFPNDNVIYLGQSYDVIVNNIITKQNHYRKGFLILSQIYHDLSEGDTLPIKISEKSRGGNSIFKIKNYFGFVIDKEWKTNIGDKLVVRIEKIKEAKNGSSILETKVCSFLK